MWLCQNFMLVHHHLCRRYLASYFTRNASTVSRGRVVFSGIQPTGVPHLGNYLGALSNWVAMQNSAAPEDTLLFSIVGWHALTLPQIPNELRSSRQEMLAVLLAIGLDPQRCIIFHQDNNQDHVELAWILNCLTGMGKLKRMVSWKTRISASRDSNKPEDVDESALNAGLFTYPVLQAADVLAYKATHVPVGDDQSQHLELSRNLAETFNRTFKDDHPLFPLPITLKTPFKRILSLRDPSAKMSKSSPNLSSRILLTDTTAEIHQKIKAAVTDSISGITYDPDNRPGTSNLLTILSACTKEEVTVTAERYRDKNHAALKTDVAEAIDALLQKPRQELLKLKADPTYLDAVAKAGSVRARELSGITTQEVRRRVGLA